MHRKPKNQKLFQRFITLTLLGVCSLLLTTEIIGYSQTEKNILIENALKVPIGAFAENIPGVLMKLPTKENIVALTLDACGGKNDIYDDEMINWLKENRIKATLFVSGIWAKKNRALLKRLAQNDLFKIENHGFLHKPASSNGRRAYRIRGTRNLQELYKEVIENKKLIKGITGKATSFYRPGTGFLDNRALNLINQLDHEVVGYNIISGDAEQPQNKAYILKMLHMTTKGSIIIIHMNHKNWLGFEALREWYEKEGKQFKFIHLDDPRAKMPP